jgi:hypothetical protein
MANTTYRSAVPITKSNLAAAFLAFGHFMEHVEVWNLDLVSLSRPTSGPNSGFLVVTLDNPIPSEHVTHLRLTGPI